MTNPLTGSVRFAIVGIQERRNVIFDSVCSCWAMLGDAKPCKVPI